jgi:hypothetical protein
MSQPTCNEYLEKMRDRYRRYSGKLAKTKLLDEFCQITGHERKYANKLLKRLRGPKRKGGLPPKQPGREKTYTPEVVGIVFEIWKHSEQPCGKRLAPMLKEWLPFYEKHYGTLAAAVGESVLSISPAQIDRVLAPKKVRFGVINRRTPKTNAAIKALVPIRAECWNAKEPGWLEADTVAHCGGDMKESFLWSLTATDIFSGWTEVRASWNRGQHSVCAAFGAIERHLPFTILGVDTDNGGEFLNYHLHHHFTGRERPVSMTRSRPYQKNDQAHVEQKNATHVRQLLGHDRLGHHLLIKPVFELLEAWSVWRNCFTTTFKQISKRREGSKTIRVHEKVPRTPCERLIGYCREVGDGTTADALDAWRGLHDPFELKQWIEKRLKVIWKLDAALTIAESAGETNLEGVAATILKGHLRSAPMALQNRKHDPNLHPQTTINPPKPQAVTKSPKVA